MNYGVNVTIWEISPEFWRLALVFVAVGQNETTK